MTELIQSLRDAPVMNLFVLVGFLLVVLAAVGKAGRRKVDTGGRLLSGTCGVGLLAAATTMFLGLSRARAALPVDTTPPGAGQLHAAPASGSPEPEPTASAMSSPAPGAARKVEGARPTQRLVSDPVNVRWVCGETVTGKATLILPDGMRLVSAKVLVEGVDNAKSFARQKPTWDRESRVCTGEATFRGLDRIFFNCPGGGHATMRIAAVVTPTTAPPAPAGL